MRAQAALFIDADDSAIVGDKSARFDVPMLFLFFAFCYFSKRVSYRGTSKYTCIVYVPQFGFRMLGILGAYKMMKNL